jgi:POT family proton-dependent oligopeptide transporter
MNDGRHSLRRTIAGHPAGIYLVAFTEMWERFSYWGFAGILVLFLTAAPSGGGWGWQDEDALRLYGWYGGLAFIVPVLGAWLANNHLGERRCIFWGGVLIVLGHASIACAWLVPALLDRLGGTDAALVLRAANVTLGLPFPGEGVRNGIEEWLESGPDSGLTVEQVLIVYLAKSWGFLTGLLLIIAGTGLLKPAISSIVASLYPAGGSRRDEGFAWFFTGIYLGALLGALVTGLLGEKLGWHYGLTAAGLGMAAGLAGYIGKQKAWLGDVGMAPRRVASSPGSTLSRAEWARIAVIVVQGTFTVLYAAGFYQMFGLLNLYAHQQLDRTVGGFEIPTTWMQTINLWSFFLCIPLLAWLWRRLAARGRNPGASYKLALGLAVLALGYLVIAAGESARDADGTALAWLVATYLLFGLGDALVWPNQISLASKLAPERYTAMAVGSWYVCIGLGTWLTGYVGAIASRYPFGDVFLALAAVCGLGALLLTALTPALKKLIPDFEE